MKINHRINTLRYQNAFTLIELLAVIVILAVILVIAVPQILGVIENSRKEAFKLSSYGIINSAKYLNVQNNEYDEIVFTYENGVESSNVEGMTLNYKGEKPQNGEIVVQRDGKISIFLKVDKWCARKRFDEKEITIGNLSEDICIPDNVEIVYNFEYTGDVQQFIVTRNGTYKLEVWGAQGGYRTDSTKGGLGGYSVGEINLTAGTTLYIHIGGSGNSGGWNGGGTRPNSAFPGGGGATDIRIGGDTLNHRLIVAGGGGSDGMSNKAGGYGGGITGESRSDNYAEDPNYSGKGGTQTSAGGVGSSYVIVGSFGNGGNGIYRADGYGGAGGGGWYGGSGTYPDGGADDDRGGGGGSGYVWSESTVLSSPLGFQLTNQYYLTNANTYDATQDIYDNGYETVKAGKVGNGFAKITYNESEDRDVQKFVYTGNVQQFIVTRNGTYKLEVWGAQGGYRTDSTNGGFGGYSVGEINLTAGTTLYLHVGGSGNSGGWNGGGARPNSAFPGGGGATDIRIGGDTLNHRLIVAGGGGSDGMSNKAGGYGGGLTGESRGDSYSGDSTYSGKGGTQTSAGGIGSTYAIAGDFGYGGTGIYRGDGYGGAGGGGWYGGSGTYPDSDTDDDRGGGGGSGYVWSESTVLSAPPGFQLTNQYYLTNANTYGANESVVFADGIEHVVGRKGNGLIIITYFND